MWKETIRFDFNNPDHVRRLLMSEEDYKWFMKMKRNEEIYETDSLVDELLDNFNKRNEEQVLEIVEVMRTK